MYFAFVRQRMSRPVAVFLFISCLGAALTGQPGLSPALEFSLGTPANLLLIVIIPAVLLVGWRRGNREAAVLLIPDVLLRVSFLALGRGYFQASLGHPFSTPWVLKPIFDAGAFPVSFLDISDILSLLVLGLIILLRSNRMSLEAALHAGELAAAREVQQILVPDRIDVISGFTVDTAYLPAQQVGGDFFQVVPVHDSGMLVVVGDVAGKGLPAAMMVSVLVGAIRTLAAFTHDPAEVLAQLNERLVGRTGGGFSTAIAVSASSDGSLRIANAGHLSPYLDGEELPLPGALPLGVLGGTTYETTTFAFKRGSRLTFYSDGVIEAQNADGDLLGFERGRELSTQPAEEIAAAAQKFGQSDDITVVTILRET